MPEASAAHASWIRQWKAAGPALAEIRNRELRELSEEEALRASEILLSLVSDERRPHEPLATSGLVEQQALFHRRGPR